MANIEGLQISESIRTKYVIIHYPELRKVSLVTTGDVSHDFWHDRKVLLEIHQWWLYHFLVHKQFILCFWPTLTLNPLASTTISQFRLCPVFFIHRDCVIIFHCVYSHRYPLLSWDGEVLISYHAKWKMKVYWYNDLEPLKYFL